MKNLNLIMSLVMLSLMSFADVCGIITKDQAEKAISFLSVGTRLELTYSDYTTLIVQDISVSKVSNTDPTNYYRLKVNGVTIDPGHTNIISENESLNLGRLIGCEIYNTELDPDGIISTPQRPYLVK